MKKPFIILKRYRFFLVLFVVNLALLYVLPEAGRHSFEITGDNLLEMLAVLPPIFVLLGLMDVWVQRETMIKYMGHGSGFKGGLFAFLLGAAAAGPLYAAFPVAAVLLKKNAKLTNVFIFIGAWSTTKIPMLLFEASNLGIPYMLIRLGCNIVGIILIAVLLEKSLPEKDKAAIYDNAEKL